MFFRDAAGELCAILNAVARSLPAVLIHRLDQALQGEIVLGR